MLNILEHQKIYDVNKIQRRIRRNRYGSSWGDDHNHTREGDQLTLFTLEPAAERASLAVLESVLATAKTHGQDLVVITESQIQVGQIGAGDGCRRAIKALFPAEWLEENDRWVDATSGVRPTFDQSRSCSDQSRSGEFGQFYNYRPNLILQKHRGVYDVKTGKRLTNRQEIIERMWAAGFAANRGRPLTYCRIRWAGEREHLEHVMELADRYWSQRRTSEVAKKICSAFTSINRYAAWPGAW